MGLMTNTENTEATVTKVTEINLPDSYIIDLSAGDPSNKPHYVEYLKSCAVRLRRAAWVLQDMFDGGDAKGQVAAQSVYTSAHGALISAVFAGPPAPGEPESVEYERDEPEDEDTTGELAAFLLELLDTLKSGDPTSHVEFDLAAPVSQGAYPSAFMGASGL